MTSCSMRGRRTGPLVLAAILGFMVWWPLGLVALAALFWGDRWLTDDVAGRVREGYGRLRDGFAGGAAGGRERQAGGWNRSGNAAFDDYRAETLRRLEEERRRLEEESRAFSEFVAELRRARDKDEFDRFMSARRGGAAA